MQLTRPFLEKGWRRTGAINVALVSTCGLIILVSMLVSIAHNKDHSLHSTTIYQGPCASSSKTSIILHLFINIVSTGILASSNFFMQIASSPTRKEVDRAHMFLQPLDIGLPSWKNVPSLTNFKKTCWLILFISSIPIHLFFNSAVYNTVYQGDLYNLTIATAAFTQNRPHYIPGASLTPPGASSPVQVYNGTGYENIYGDSYRNRTYIEGYGNPVSPAEFMSGFERSVTGDIAQQCSHWKQMDPDECLREYRTNSYRLKYADLIIIVLSGAKDPDGWQRDEVFKFTNSTTKDIWDGVVPTDRVNSLWFWTQCHYDRATTVSSSSWNCHRILSQPVSFLHDGQPDASTARNETAYGYKAMRREVHIQGCLAEPVETCQVLVSNSLLLAVLFCVLFKVGTCVAILWRQRDASLVTPGDAIESFITDPDIYTRGLATLDNRDSQSLQCSPRELLEAAREKYFVSSIRPRRWRETRHRLLSTIPRGT